MRNNNSLGMYFCSVHERYWDSWIYYRCPLCFHETKQSYDPNWLNLKDSTLNEEEFWGSDPSMRDFTAENILTAKPGEVFRKVTPAPGTANMVSPDKALRYDTGKTRWELLPTDGLRVLAEHFTKGAAKYACRNWELGMAYSRCYDSLMRHLSAWWEGEERDAETGSLHITAVVWNSLALLVYTIRGVGTDDRPKLNKEKNSG